MSGLQADRPRPRFAGRLAVGGRFDRVVKTVPDQMIEWGFELFEDIAVDARILARDHELDLLVELPREVADKAGEAANPVGHRPHPARQDLVVKPPPKGLHCAARSPRFLPSWRRALDRTGPPGPSPSSTVPVRPCGLPRCRRSACPEDSEGWSTRPNAGLSARAANRRTV